MASARAVLAVIDDEQLPFGVAVGYCGRRPSGIPGAHRRSRYPPTTATRVEASATSTDSPPTAGGRWNQPIPGRLLAARVIDDYAALGREDLLATLDVYADAAALVGRADLQSVADSIGRAQMTETVVIGTVLGDALFAGLRRMAHEATSRTLFPVLARRRGGARTPHPILPLEERIMTLDAADGPPSDSRHSPRSLLADLRPVYWNRPLLVLAVAMVGLAVASSIGAFVDPREVTGLNVWVKPLKFAISTAIYSVTLAWLVGQVVRWRRVARIGATIAAVALAVELVIITGYAVFAETSHFNVTTPLHAAAWATMAFSIVAVWVVTLVVAFALFRNRLGDRARSLAIRVGALIAVLGMGLAFLMTGPQGDQISNYNGIIGAHTVGAADGGPGLPLLGWSTEAGDLRVAHFVGMHALQALPIFVILLELLARRVPLLADGTLRFRLVAIAAGTYLAVVGLTVVAGTPRAVRRATRGCRCWRRRSRWLLSRSRRRSRSSSVRGGARCIARRTSGSRAVGWSGHDIPRRPALLDRHRCRRPRSVLPVADRHAARRNGAHRPVQLGVRAPHGRHDDLPHRRHRRGARQRGELPAVGRRAALARPRLG